MGPMMAITNIPHPTAWRSRAIVAGLALIFYSTALERMRLPYGACVDCFGTNLPNVSIVTIRPLSWCLASLKCQAGVLSKIGLCRMSGTVGT